MYYALKLLILTMQMFSALFRFHVWSSFKAYYILQLACGNRASVAGLKDVFTFRLTQRCIIFLKRGLCMQALVK